MGKEKGRKVEKSGKHRAAARSPPPPPPPRPTWSSHTRREIERFWRKKRLVEEDHLLAAIKAAARIRASHLSAEDYKLFLESLVEYNIKEERLNGTHAQIKSGYNNNQEIRVGIQDWWTKSRYAYLNQPADGSSTVRLNRRSNYIPNSMYVCNYKLLSYPANTASAKAPYIGVY